MMTAGKPSGNAMVARTSQCAPPRKLPRRKNRRAKSGQGLNSARGSESDPEPIVIRERRWRERLLGPPGGGAGPRI